MNVRACPDPEELAVFAARACTEASWRKVVRHLAACEVCRRQVELLDLASDPSVPAEVPTTAPPPLPAGRPRTWHRIAQGVAAAAVLSAVLYFLLSRPEELPKKVAESSKPSVAPEPPRPQRQRRIVIPEPNAPAPRPAPPREERSDHLPAPKEPDEPREVIPVPAPSPFLVERAPAAVIQPIEVAVRHGELARVAGGETSPLPEKATVGPSDAVRAPGGGSLVLPDGATLHLSRESEVALSWSQTDACARVELRQGEALLEPGRAPKPICVSSGAVSVLLRDPSGSLWLSRGESEFRATPLSGTAGFRAPGGASGELRALESLVLRAEGDRLEETPDPTHGLRPRFPSLQPSPAPEPPRAPAADKNIPDAGELLDALAAQSYAFRVLGRHTREGVWMPPNVLQSTLGDFTAVRRANDGGALHVRRGLRGWDDLGNIQGGSREARHLDTVRQAPAPHAAVQQLLPALRGEPRVKTEQVGDRQCCVWEFDLDPETIRESVKALFASAVAEGRVSAPDSVLADSLRGSLEFAAPRTEPRLVRVVDRRRISYSYKTVGGLDRRTYNLETAYEFTSHGQATLKLPIEMIRELFPGRK